MRTSSAAWSPRPPRPRVTVHSTDGFTATYAFATNAKVRKQKAASRPSAVAVNDRVGLVAAKGASGSTVTALRDSGPARSGWPTGPHMITIWAAKCSLSDHSAPGSRSWRSATGVSHVRVVTGLGGAATPTLYGLTSWCL